MIFLLGVALVVIVCGGPYLVLGLWKYSELRRDRAGANQRARAAETDRRLKAGLPPHERCLCDECRVWRSVPGNQEQLRLRGRR